MSVFERRRGAVGFAHTHAIGSGMKCKKPKRLAAAGITKRRGVRRAAPDQRCDQSFWPAQSCVRWTTRVVFQAC